MAYESPFDYYAYTQILGSKERLQDLRKKGDMSFP